MRTAPRENEPLVEFSPRAVREIAAKELLVRFAFGAGISAVAGVIGTVLGDRVGGMLLAFPAILPATLTLIEEKDTERRARGDDVGSIFGAIGLVAFALVAWLLLSRAGALGALIAASAAWLSVAALLYVAVRAVALRRVRRGRDPAGPPR